MGLFRGHTAWVAATLCQSPLNEKIDNYPWQARTTLIEVYTERRCNAKQVILKDTSSAIVSSIFRGPDGRYARLCTFLACSHPFAHPRSNAHPCCGHYKEIVTAKTRHCCTYCSPNALSTLFADNDLHHELIPFCAHVCMPRHLKLWSCNKYTDAHLSILI
eukprot:SAG25_NODE_468_length_7680_cov_92.421185_2_plen_161_part_00